jgi:hypothetical protein
VKIEPCKDIKNQSKDAIINNQKSIINLELNEQGIVIGEIFNESTNENTLQNKTQELFQTITSEANHQMTGIINEGKNSDNNEFDIFKQLKHKENDSISKPVYDNKKAKLDKSGQIDVKKGLEYVKRIDSLINIGELEFGLIVEVDLVNQNKDIINEILSLLENKFKNVSREDIMKEMKPLSKIYAVKKENKYVSVIMFDEFHEIEVINISYMCSSIGQYMCSDLINRTKMRLNKSECIVVESSDDCIKFYTKNKFEVCGKTVVNYLKQIFGMSEGATFMHYGKINVKLLKDTKFNINKLFKHTLSFVSSNISLLKRKRLRTFQKINDIEFIKKLNSSLLRIDLNSNELEFMILKELGKQKIKDRLCFKFRNKGDYYFVKVIQKSLRNNILQLVITRNSHSKCNKTCKSDGNTCILRRYQLRVSSF